MAQGDWPPDCPPHDSEDANHVVFRITRKNPCAASDFKTLHEREAMPQYDPCLRCGISVYTVQDHAVLKARQYERRLGKYISRGTLQATHGKLKQTADWSHHTWWPAAGFERHLLFQVVDEI